MILIWIFKIKNGNLLIKECLNLKEKINNIIKMNY